MAGQGRRSLPAGTRLQTTLKRHWLKTVVVSVEGKDASMCPPERCPHRRPRIVQLSGTGNAKGTGPASFGCQLPIRVVAHQAGSPGTQAGHHRGGRQKMVCYPQ